MKAIIVIRGVTTAMYQEIRQDLTSQFIEQTAPIPLFAHLPDDYPQIEVVWIDEKIEKENFLETLRQHVENIKYERKENA